jgi:hypothetical protein
LIRNDLATQLVFEALPPGVQVVITTDHSFGHGRPCSAHSGHTHTKCPNTWAVSFPALPALGPRLMDVPIPLRP